MDIRISAEDFLPIIDDLADALVKKLGADCLFKADNRLSYPEAEAAKLMGVGSHVLRDARLRGEITATKVGGRHSYEKTELLRYLADNRQVV